MEPGSTVRWLAPCAVSAGMAGCFPYHLTDAPAVSGRVVDARTRQPAVGASVESVAPNGPVTTTNARGTFALPAARRWILFIPGMDFSIPTLTVKAHGYGGTRVFLPIGEAVELDHPIALSTLPGEMLDSSFLPASTGLR